MSDKLYSNFSEKQLKFGYWLTKHRVVIKAILLSLGFLLIGSLVIYNTKVIIDYYSQTEIVDLQAGILATDNFSLINNYRVKPLVWQPVQIVKRGEQTVDLVVEVTNYNLNYAVTNLSYHFFMAGWQSDVEIDYLLPNQTKKLIYTNIDVSEMNYQFLSDLQAQVIIDKVAWQRLKDSKYYDADKKFISSGLTSSDYKLVTLQPNLHTFSFVLTNNSVYNYAEVEARVFLYNGPNIVALNVLSVNDVLSEEDQDVVLRWFTAIPPVTKMEVELSTNLIDPDNFKRFTLDQFE